MITFKQYLYLAEDVFAHGEHLKAAVNDTSGRRASTEKSISTNRNDLGKQTGTTRGNEVHYAFSYKPSEDSTELLKSLKGTGKLKLDPKDRAKFISDTAQHMADKLKGKGSWDVVVTPSSSSSFLKDFAEELADKLGIKARKIGAFKKVSGIELPADRAAAFKYVREKFIDHKYADEKFSGSPEMRASMEKELARGIINSIRKHGHIVGKDLPKRFAKFAKGQYTSDLQGDESSLKDKDVLIVDDVLSSGSTMTDLFRAVKELGAKSVKAATPFARTSASKKKE